MQPSDMYMMTTYRQVPVMSVGEVSQVCHASYGKANY